MEEAALYRKRKKKVGIRMEGNKNERKKTGEMQIQRRGEKKNSIKERNHREKKREIRNRKPGGVDLKEEEK